MTSIIFPSLKSNLFSSFAHAAEEYAYSRVGQNCAPSVQTTNFSVPLKRRVNLIDEDFSKVQKNHEKNHH
ncbi:MAG: hypothetical protein ACKVT2_18055, partial [Saprospiraceae bacterium]